MTPAELDRRVAICIAAVRERVPSCPHVPADWTRYCQGLLLRQAMRRVDPESEQAEVLGAVIGRLGLVVDG